MKQDETKYPNIFTIEERKKIIAQTIKTLRISKNLSQKEVAAHIGVSQATFSAYERGRNEPPAEIIVRLSYLFDCPIDILMQRERKYRTPDDVVKQMAECKEQFAEFGKQLVENGMDSHDISSMLDMMGKLADALTSYSQTDTAHKAINLPESK